MLNKKKPPREILYLPIVLLLFSINVFAQDTFLQKIEKDITHIITKARPGIVQITSYFTAQDISAPQPENPGYTKIGAGVIIDSVHVLTKLENVLGSKEIQITTFDNEQIDAEFISADPELGLALIKSPQKFKKPVKWGLSASLAAGNYVVIIGNSLSVIPAVSFGHVNCIRNDDMIQLSTYLTNSEGDFVFNSSAQLVGIISSQLKTFVDEKNPGMLYINDTILAYPGDKIQKTLKQLLPFSQSPNGWIGVSAENWPGIMGGIHIRQVTPSSPAQEAGIKMGDIIISINGKRVTQTLELASFITQQRPGTSVDLKILRSTGTKDIKLTIGQPPTNLTSDYKPISMIEKSRSAQIPTKAFQASYTKMDTRQDKQYILNRIMQLEKEIENLKQLSEKF